MQFVQTAERVSHKDRSDNYVFQRSILAYVECPGICNCGQIQTSYSRRTRNGRKRKYPFPANDGTPSKRYSQRHFRLRHQLSGN